MTNAAYVHSISPILQVCLSKERIRTKLQEEETKLKEIQRRRAKERARTARNVVGHDFVPRKSPSHRVSEQETEECRSTRHSEVCSTTFPGTPRKFSKTTEIIEQCRVTRHFKENPTPHDILQTDEQKREHFRAARHLSRATRLLGEISINT